MQLPGPLKKCVKDPALRMVLRVSAAQHSFIHAAFPFNLSPIMVPFLWVSFSLACPSNAFSLTFVLLLISFCYLSLSLTLGLLRFFLPTSFSPASFLNPNFFVSFLSLGSLRIFVSLYHSFAVCLFHLPKRVPGLEHTGLSISGSTSRVRGQMISPSLLVLHFDGRGKELLLSS